MTATFTVGEGTLALAAGDSGVSITANNASTVTFTGTLSQINALVTGTSTGTIVYNNGSDTPSASTTITLTVNDGGNTGTDPGLTADGTSEQDSASQTINLTATNDDPTNAGSLPSDVAVTEDVLTAVDLSAIDFSDVDAASSDLTVTLSTATGGELTLAADPSIDFGGTATARTLTGTLAELNAYFNNASNIQYLHGTQHLNGDNADTITVVINDNGNTGTGGGTDQTLGTINVDITAVNDDPTNASTLPTDINVIEDLLSALDLSTIDFSDVDAAASDLTVTLSTATGGQLTLAADANIDFSGTATARTLTGTLAELNNYFNNTSNIQYLNSTPNTFGDNADTLSIVINDNGNTGTGGGADLSLADINIDIDAVNDAPTIVSNGGGNSAAISIDENIAAITTILATDIDNTPSEISYSIAGGDDAALFQIDSVTGELSFINPPDRENALDADDDHVYEVTVRASDGALTDTQNLSITVNDVDEFDVAAPADSDGNTNAVDENVSLGTAVGITIDAADNDATNNAVTYSLTNDAGGLFDIDGNSGLVTVAANLDREVLGSTQTITVRASSQDGSFAESSFTINIEDVDEFDVASLDDADLTLNSVNENELPGVSVGITASAIDADATNSQLTFSLDQDADGRFQIDPNTGEVTTTRTLDYETVSLHQITVRATSADGSTITKDFAISVGDVNDAPTATGTQYQTTFIESLVIDPADLLANASDADGDDISVVLVAGPSVGGLQTDANGNLVYVPVSNFVGTEIISYMVTDGQLNSAVVQIEISVGFPAVQTPAPETPTDNSNDNGSSNDPNDNSSNDEPTDTNGNDEPTSNSPNEPNDVTTPLDSQTTPAAVQPIQDEAAVGVPEESEQARRGVVENTSLFGSLALDGIDSTRGLSSLIRIFGRSVRYFDRSSGTCKNSIPNPARIQC